MSSLILTARFDQDAQVCFDELRERYFPPERNFLASHLTLFHALPSSELPLIQSQLASLCQGESKMPGSAAGLRSLGNGVAFEIECPRLVRLRDTLASLWQDRLGRQDRQRFRPHVTVQNKVPPAAARALLHNLRQNFAPIPVTFEGLDLWSYLGGPWELAAAFRFSELKEAADAVA